MNSNLEGVLRAWGKKSFEIMGHDDTFLLHVPSKEMYETQKRKGTVYFLEVRLSNPPYFSVTPHAVYVVCIKVRFAGADDRIDEDNDTENMNRP